jgi:putative ABC transport system ATP-binding protein
MHDPLISARGLTKVYREGDREHVVLRPLDVDIHPGELVVLLGRSGSGKSTLLNLLAGIDRPSAGDLTVAGVDLVRADETARTLLRRRAIGFVFQFFNLVPTLTVEENLLLPLELLGRRSGGERARARELLAAVGLADRAGQMPDRLSGGEQQRVAIARALVHEPPLVLADEPTGNLDLDTGLLVLDLLDRLARQRGATLVMATHSAEVVGLADRVLRIVDGQLAAQAPGSTAELAAGTTRRVSAAAAAPPTSRSPVG